jgi:hypothetical protein
VPGILDKVVVVIVVAQRSPRGGLVVPNLSRSRSTTGVIAELWRNAASAPVTMPTAALVRG